jgi:hypothetical protein
MSSAKAREVVKRIADVCSPVAGEEGGQAAAGIDHRAARPPAMAAL